MMTLRDPRMELRCWSSVLSDTCFPPLGLEPQLCLRGDGRALPVKEKILGSCGHTSVPSSRPPSTVPALRSHTGRTSVQQHLAGGAAGSPIYHLCTVGVNCWARGAKWSSLTATSVPQPPPPPTPPALRCRFVWTRSTWGSGTGCGGSRVPQPLCRWLGQRRLHFTPPGFSWSPCSSTSVTLAQDRDGPSSAAHPIVTSQMACYTPRPSSD